MEAIGLLVTLESRAGKERDAEVFLKSAQPLALEGRHPHLAGDIAKAFGARASELFAVPPQVEKVEILANTPIKG
jgi:hypothetical protein